MLPPSAVGFSISGIVNQEAQPSRKAWAIRTGDVELADVLGGDIRVGTHVHDVDAVHMVSVLEVLDGLGDNFPGNVRFAQTRFIRH